MSDDPFFCPGCEPIPRQEKFPHRWVNTRWTAEEWTIDYKQPRTCTGCGGIHPEDVLQMLKDGFTDEMTTKTYKGYLHSPGYRAELIAWHKSVDKLVSKANPDAPNPQAAAIGAGDLFKKVPMPADPIKAPPMKFYTYHFTDAQCAELNRLSQEIRKTLPAPW